MANFDYDGELKPRRSMSSKKKNDRLKHERGKTRMRKVSTVVRQKIDVRDLEEYMNEGMYDD